MSHVSKLTLVVNDLDSLDKAADRLGMKLNRNVTTYRSYQRGLRCEHSLSVKDNANAYEVGLVRSQDGKGYDLMMDFYAGGQGLVERVSYEARGRDCNKLKDWYAAEVAAKQLRKQGYMVNAVQQDRKVQVLATK